jgi:glycerol-3-phosphate acyltransferase PlsY
METLITLIFFSFLLGSVPTGALIARAKGVDLRKVGSGNIGATNVLRALGKEAALITLLGDIAKGAVPVLIARHLFSGYDIMLTHFAGLDSLITKPLILIEGIVGLSAILGHNYSVFLKFKGGKGVATSLGVILAISPHVALITVTIWLFTLARSGYSSLSALVSFGVLPLTIYIADRSNEKIIIVVVIAVLIFIRHIPNIKRLIDGTENRIFKKEKK